MKSSAPRFPAVDGLRAMAMLMVFSYHIWQFADYPRYALRLGSRSFEILGNAGLLAQGVDVFMVLSGFCLFFPFCARPERLQTFAWKTYALKRVRRIAPPYYAAIIYALALRGGIAVLLHLLGKQTAWPTFPSFFDVLAHLTFTHTLFESTFFGITGAFWSLGLEAQFYLVFPLVIVAVARFGARAIIALVVISLFYQAIAHFLGWGDVRAVQNFFLGRWMQFAAGMGAAVLVAKLNARDQKISTLAGIGLVALAVALFFAPAPDYGPFLSAFALRGLMLSFSVSLLLLAVCTSTAPVRFLWSNRVMAGLGFISYSFFLIHQPTMQYVAQFLKNFGPHLQGLSLFCVLATFGFSLCVVISYGFFLVFEKRFMNLPRQEIAKVAQ